MIKFGDIFRFNEQEFVFLAQTEEITYTAKILTKEHTGQVKNLYDAKVKNNSISKVKNNVLYSFVILETDKFKGRMAHFKDTDKNGLDSSFDTIGSLNNKDLSEIKEEILNQYSAVPLKLKELVKDIFIGQDKSNPKS
jgi:hypothetical protein